MNQFDPQSRDTLKKNSVFTPVSSTSPPSPNYTSLLLRAVAWLLFAIAGIAFLIGGRWISESAKIDGIFAEILGLGIAVGCAVAGHFLKSAAADDFDGKDNSTDPSA